MNGQVGVTTDGRGEVAILFAGQGVVADGLGGILGAGQATAQRV